MYVSQLKLIVRSFRILLKTIFPILLLTVSFSIFAKNETKMNEKTIVIKYDNSLKQLLQTSTAKIHINTKFSLHNIEDVNITILGETIEIFIPGIKESFLFISDDKFNSGIFHLSPNSKWYSFEIIKKQAIDIRPILAKIRSVALSHNGIAINNLSEEYFTNKEIIILDSYQLENYKIFFIMKKFPVPKNVIPRDHDYFQLYFRIENVHT